MSAILQAMRIGGANHARVSIKLCIACKDGDLKAVCKLIAKGASVAVIAVRRVLRAWAGCGKPHSWTSGVAGQSLDAAALRV